MTTETRVIFSSDLPDEYREEFLSEELIQRRLIFIFQQIAPSKIDLTFRLSSKNARSEIIALYFGRERMQSDIKIKLFHEAPDTFGRIFFKAVLWDCSRLSVSALSDIKKEGSGSDSHLDARTLLISEKAIAEIHPYLEIRNNDVVRASHASGVGKLDEKSLFYLKSRGLSQKQSEKILIGDFLKDVWLYLPKAILNQIHSQIYDQCF